jgi:hypothetical protein
MLITKEKKKKKIAIITTTKINTEKFISTYTDIFKQGNIFQNQSKRLSVKISN